MLDYAYSKENGLNFNVEREGLKSRFKGLPLASSLSSIFYDALNMCPSDLWVTNKITKSSSDLVVQDIETFLFWAFKCNTELTDIIGITVTS